MTKNILHKLEHLEEDIDMIMEVLAGIEACSCNIGPTLPPPTGYTSLKLSIDMITFDD